MGRDEKLLQEREEEHIEKQSDFFQAGPKVAVLQVRVSGRHL